MVVKEHLCLTELFMSEQEKNRSLFVNKHPADKTNLSCRNLLPSMVEAPDCRSTRWNNIHAYTIANKTSYNMSKNIKTFKSPCRLLLARLSGQTCKLKAGDFS